MKGYALLLILFLVPISFSYWNNSQAWNQTNGKGPFVIASNSNITIEIKAPSKVKYSYNIENNTLILSVSVQRGNPCQYLNWDYVEISPGNYKVYLYLIQRGEVCIQVVPKEPATAEIRIPLEENVSKVYVEISMKGEGYEECWELRERLREAIKKGDNAEIENITEQLREMCGWEIGYHGNYTNMTEEEIKEIINNVTMVMNRTRKKIENRTMEQNMTKIMNKTGVVNVTIIHEKGKKIMKHGNVSVELKTEVIVEGNKIKLRNGKVINVTPEEVKVKVQHKLERITKLELTEENGEPVYVAEGEEEGKLLGFIQVKMKVRVKVDAENGEVIKEEKPWWAFLVFG